MQTFLSSGSVLFPPIQVLAYNFYFYYIYYFNRNTSLYGLKISCMLTFKFKNIIQGYYFYYNTLEVMLPKDFHQEKQAAGNAYKVKVRHKVNAFGCRIYCLPRKPHPSVLLKRRPSGSFIQLISHWSSSPWTAPKCRSLTWLPHATLASEGRYVSSAMEMNP